MLTKIKLAGVVKESIVDGPGLRFTIFVQGCTRRCTGCHNPQSWDHDGGYWGSAELIIDEVKKNPTLAGITFTGGEPFEQAKQLAHLAKLAHENGLNIVTYTGYTFEELMDGFQKNPGWEELMMLTDYLVDGPFIQEQKSLNLKFRGSRNQRFIDVKQTFVKNAVVEAKL